MKEVLIQPLSVHVFRRYKGMKPIGFLLVTKKNSKAPEKEEENSAEDQETAEGVSMPHRNGSRWLWRPVYCSRIPLAVCQSGLEEHSFSRRDIVPRQEGDRHGPDEPEPSSSASIKTVRRLFGSVRNSNREGIPGVGSAFLW